MSRELTIAARKSLSKEEVAAKQVLERLAYESAAAAIQGYLELTIIENGRASDVRPIEGQAGEIYRGGFLIRGTSVSELMRQ